MGVGYAKGRNGCVGKSRRELQVGETVCTKVLGQKEHKWSTRTVSVLPECLTHTLSILFDSQEMALTVDRMLSPHLPFLCFLWLQRVEGLERKQEKGSGTFKPLQNISCILGSLLHFFTPIMTDDSWDFLLSFFFFFLFFLWLFLPASYQCLLGREKPRVFCLSACFVICVNGLIFSAGDPNEGSVYVCVCVS